MNLTRCQEERQSALDKSALDPPLLGVFKPKCKPDGQYEDQQCHELYCWCVDRNGLKIPGTTIQGPAICLPRGKKQLGLLPLLIASSCEIFEVIIRFVPASFGKQFMVSLSPSPLKSNCKQTAVNTCNC